LVSGGQLSGGTNGPCAEEVRMEKNNKGTLKGSQSLLMWRAKGWLAWIFLGLSPPPLLM